MYIYMYVFVDHSANSISSRGDYSRAASISFNALAQVRLLFESGVYSRAASIRSYTVYTFKYLKHPNFLDITILITLNNYVVIIWEYCHI